MIKEIYVQKGLKEDKFRRKPFRGDKIVEYVIKHTLEILSIIHTNHLKRFYITDNYISSLFEEINVRLETVGDKVG